MFPAHPNELPDEGLLDLQRYKDRAAIIYQSLPPWAC